MFITKNICLISHHLILSDCLLTNGNLHFDNKPSICLLLIRKCHTQPSFGGWLKSRYPVRMLDAEFLLPVRATNSRQENTKSPIISRFFCACRSGVLPFFPFILGFFFQFFCCVQCCWSRWPTAKRRYRHFHKSHFFSKLSHTR